MKRQIIFGPPGTGKTTELLNILEKEIDSGIDPKKIAFVSFTRKAVYEAIDRVVDRFKLSKSDLHLFKTLHALAYQQLGLTKDNILGYPHLKQLGKQLGLKIVTKLDVSEGLPPAGSELGSKYLFINQLSRAKRVSIEEAWEFVNDYELLLPDVIRFDKAYEKYKQDNSVMDFTDMLEVFNRARESPKIDVLIVDEAQDLFPLQWETVKILEVKAKRVYVAGDDDQCQPGDTMIETTKGKKSLASLNPKTDRLLSYAKNDTCIYGKRNGGYSFKKKKRLYKESMFSFFVGRNPDNIVNATINHKWLVKWTPEAKKSKVRVVYLMRQGSKFRIGHCQLFNSEGILHLWARAKNEKADAVWILKTFDDPQSSYVYEQVVSAKYGILQTPFVSVNNTNLTQWVINKIFLDAPTPDIKECLKEHGRDYHFPFRTKEQVNQRGSVIMELQSCNIIPEIMMLPIYTGSQKPQWEPVTNIESFPSDPPYQYVYSLDVEKYHTYIANGVITCNSLYDWSGADVNIFLNLKGSKRVLDKSYRLPKNIFKLANIIASKIKTRKDKTWKPLKDGGEVVYELDLLNIDLHDKKSWFLLARNVYLLERLEAIAQTQGVVYDIRGRSSVKPDEAQAILDWERLRKGEALDTDSIRNVYQFLRSRVGITRGFKTLNKATRPSYTIKGLIEECGLLTEDPWFTALSMIPEDRRIYYRSVLARKEGLFQPPRVHINTIHGVKGGEADNVCLLTDMAYKSYQGLLNSPDSEHRCFYVGITRAKEKLVIIQPEGRFYYPL